MARISARTSPEASTGAGTVVVVLVVLVVVGMVLGIGGVSRAVVLGRVDVVEGFWMLVGVGAVALGALLLVAGW